MIKTNVSNEEYNNFQGKIYSLYDKWNQQLSVQTIAKKEEAEGKTYPLLPQLNLKIDEKDYRTFLEDLFSELKDYKPELGENINQLESLLDSDTIKKWSTEIVSVNTYYFNRFAQEHNLPEWLPLFLAEHAVRPYLQKAAAELKETVKLEGHFGGCPVCGEPPRLALINKSGKKELTCPRCHFSWEEKKISCAYCGSDDHEQISVLKVEGEDSAEIYACKQCNGYTKVINTRALTKVPAPEVLDLKTIHLDYIAQEKGYGVMEGKETH